MGFIINAPWNYMYFPFEEKILFCALLCERKSYIKTTTIAPFFMKEMSYFYIMNFLVVSCFPESEKRGIVIYITRLLSPLCTRCREFVVRRKANWLSDLYSAISREQNRFFFSLLLRFLSYWQNDAELFCNSRVEQSHYIRQGNL